ncbi:MAG TPA: YciI family protein [Bryobacteraceae bacterium]|jgi:uncharacterized protein YciI
MSRTTFACVTALALQLALFPVIAAAQAPATAEAPPAKVTVLLIYRPGPSWIAGKSLAQQPLAEHGRYMLSLYSKGFLKKAGPFSDGAGGAVILEVPNFEAALAIADADPAVKSGIFVHELHPWGLIDWDKFSKQQPAK